MKKFKVILLTLAIGIILALILTSCNFTLDLNHDSMTGSVKSSDGQNKSISQGDNLEEWGTQGQDNEDESEYQESDIIKVYNNNIYYLNRKGLKIVHIDQGYMEMNNRLDKQNKNGSDVLVYKNNLILLLNVLVPNPTHYHIRCEISIYDIANLNNQDFNFPLIKTVELEGSLRSARIYNGELYVLTTDRAKSGEFNYSIDGVGHNIEGLGLGLDLVNDFRDLNIIVKLDILDVNEELQINAYYGELKEFGLYPERAYLIFSAGASDKVVQISTQTLQHLQLLELESGFTLIDRYAIHDDGHYFMVASGNEIKGANLTIYNALDFNQVISEIHSIFPGERVTNVSFTQEYCYIVTALFERIIVDPVVKINIKDVTNPVIEDYQKVDSFSQIFSLIPNTDLAFSLAGDLVLSLYNVSGDEVALIDTIDLKTYLTYCLASVDPRYITLDLENHTIFFFGYYFRKADLDMNIICDNNIIGINYSEELGLWYNSLTTTSSNLISFDSEIDLLYEEKLLLTEIINNINFERFFETNDSILLKNEDASITLNHYDFLYLINLLLYNSELYLTEETDIKIMLIPFTHFHMIYYNLYNSRCIIQDNFLYYVSIDEIISYDLALNLEMIDVLEFDKNTVDIFDLGEEPVSTILLSAFLMLFFSAEGFYAGELK